MAKNTSRSMNEGLTVGAVDGKVRMLRPDSEGSEEWASERSSVLHEQHYGSMGISRSSFLTAEQRPDQAVREIGKRLSAHDEEEY